MNCRTYFQKLNDAKTKSCLENAYSHVIYQLFDIVLDDTMYSLVDTSVLRKGKNDVLAPDTIIAVPDFVITNAGFQYNEKSIKEKALGCIEIKFRDIDVEDTSRLDGDEKTIGYLRKYHNVIYTNGWIWKIYQKSNDNCETIDFRKNQTNAQYGRLLQKLCSVKWESPK